MGRSDFSPDDMAEHLMDALRHLRCEADRAAGRLKDRVANRVADRLADAVTRRTSAVVLTEHEYAEYLATVEVLEDEEAMEALREADRQPDSEARSYDDIRRELGIAKDPV